MLPVTSLFAALVCAVLLSSSAEAACSGSSGTGVTPNEFVTAQTPATGFLRFTSSATPLSYTTVLTGAAGCGTDVNALWVSSSDISATHNVYCAVIDSTFSYGVSFATTALSPQGGGFHAASINMFSSTAAPGLPRDSNGNPHLLVAPGDTLACAFVTSITSADELTFYAQGGIW